MTTTPGSATTFGADFLEAQARIGLGDVSVGRKLLDRVLEADPSNAYAADLIAELELQSVNCAKTTLVITLPDSSEPQSAADLAIHYNAGYVWMISSVAALGGLLFGYDWVVIGGAKPFYESYFHLTSETAIGWANSCALIGCLAGSILSGALSERFGRKKLLILSAMLFAVSSVLTGWAFTFTAFVAWRIAGGIAIGIASNVSPTYIAEVSPAPWRGRLVTLNQLTIVVGILAAQIMNWLIAERVAPTAPRKR